MNRRFSMPIEPYLTLSFCKGYTTVNIFKENVGRRYSNRVGAFFLLQAIGGIYRHFLIPPILTKEE